MTDQPETLPGIVLPEEEEVLPDEALHPKSVTADDLDEADAETDVEIDDE